MIGQQRAVPAKSKGRSGKPRAFLPCPKCTYRTNDVERMRQHLEAHDKRRADA